MWLESLRITFLTDVYASKGGGLHIFFNAHKYLHRENSNFRERVIVLSLNNAL